MEIRPRFYETRFDLSQDLQRQQMALIEWIRTGHSAACKSGLDLVSVH